MKLSLCISTFNRGAWIGETIQALLPQLTPEVELLVLDGASPDNTPQVMASLVARDPRIVYRRETVNGGVDADFDKAVMHARGEYCWLLSDDDVPVPDAVATVLAALHDAPTLVVVNAEFRSKDLSMLLKPALMNVDADRTFEPAQLPTLFALAGECLSFIGSVVVRRDVWMSRAREPYYGSLFIHVGVLFQAPPLPGRTRIIARPLVAIRYGNAMWSARGFEVWMFKWPQLVWSFEQMPVSARAAVVPPYPATSLKALLHYRAIGAYGPAEHDQLLIGGGQAHHRWAHAVARLPARALNAGIALYCLLRRHTGARMMVQDLMQATCASATARWVARCFRIPVI